VAKAGGYHPSLIRKKQGKKAGTMAQFQQIKSFIFFI
jgi:hypothetical protein